MTIYNVNLGIGWASSGVEYAQAYRAEIFRKLGIPAKFIFMDMFQVENLQHFTKNIGFLDEEIIWLYSYFTDIRIAESTYPLSDLKASFTDEVSRTERNGALVRFYFDDKDYYATVSLHDTDKEYVQRVEYVAKGQLFRKDYYSYTKVFSEFYSPKENQPILYLRTFFNEDGSVAYEESCLENDSVFMFPGKIFYSKSELISEMFRTLDLNESDLVLLDRATGIGQAIFENHGKAKLGVVIHAEHYNDKSTDADQILWNNYYEYQFTNADKVDVFIASTEAQTQTLRQQLSHYSSLAPKIVAIPVGSLENLKQPEDARKPYSMVTASRLASEKHIDWLVKAVISAKESLPDLSFDIYGEGGQRQLLEKIIKEAQAEEYITLKGHQSLADVYQNYEIYLTGSTSEGFGLTLMEAVGAGLPMIGLDVPYGNQTFIENGKNGFLIQRQEPGDADQMAEAFASKILEFYKTANLESAIAHSYDIAKAFLESELKLKWSRLVEELT